MMSSRVFPHAFVIVAILAMSHANQAKAFLPMFGWSGPVLEEAAPKNVDVDPALPFFSESKANMVVRINPNSDKMADPALRDAVLALVMMATRGMPGFPLAIEGTEETLEWADGGQTMTAYNIALDDFDGPSEEIAALASDVGLVAAQDLPIHVTAGSETASTRSTLRAILGALKSAGYAVGADGLMADREGKPLKIYIRPAGSISASQIGALTSGLRTNAGPVGITVGVQNQEEFSIQSLITTDVLLSVENADMKSSLLAWLGAFEMLDEIAAFIDALPEQLSPREQVTSLALVDQHLTRTGYVVPVAKVPGDVDLSTKETRHSGWKPMLADRYLRERCQGAERIWFLGLTTEGIAFVVPTHSTVLFLPERGGSDVKVGIWANISQVEIPDRGELLFGRAAAPEGEPARVWENAYLAVPVRRAGDVLIMEDPAEYLQLLEEYEVSEIKGSSMTYRIGGEEEREISEDAKGAITPERLGYHNTDTSLTRCLRTLADNPEALTYGPAASLE